jgi:hypothetical protein
MHKLLLKLTILLLFTTCSIHLYSQKIKVQTKSIEEIDNKLVVKYDLAKSKTDQKFNISIEITGSNGYILQTKSLSGDIGKNISGGTKKQIVWDYNADGIVLNETINIEVLADPIFEESLTIESVSMGKALFLSTILPGLGMSKIEKGKPYWLMGCAAYGTLAYSYILNKKANENYDAYLTNTDKTLNDELLSDSQHQNKLSKTMAYTAIGIWSISLVWTAIKAKNTNRKIISNLNNKNFDFYTGYDPFTKSAGFNLRLRF